MRSGDWTLSPRSFSSLGLLCINTSQAFPPSCKFANALQPVLPAFGHAIAMFGQDQTHGKVQERQARADALRLRANLDMIDGRIRHGHRSAICRRRDSAIALN